MTQRAAIIPAWRCLSATFGGEMEWLHRHHPPRITSQWNAVRQVAYSRNTRTTTNTKTPHATTNQQYDHTAPVAEHRAGVAYLLTKPGDSGEPTSIARNLSKDVKARPILWRCPPCDFLGPFANYGYEKGGIDLAS